MEHSLLFLLYRLLLVITGTIACSRVGSDIQTFSDADSFRGLFLNLGAPSQCRGIVTAWHLHYQLDDCESDSSKTRTRPTPTKATYYTGVFIVYRPINVTNQTSSYEAVPGSMKSVTISCDEENEERAQSREKIILLQTNEQFMIQRDDVIAVCLPEFKKKHRNILQILEDEKEIERNDIYVYKQKNYVKDCNSNKLQTIRSQQLKVKSSYRLHLYAEIEGLELLTTTPELITGTSTEHSLPLNDTSENQMLDSDDQILYLRTIPASAGGLLMLIGVALLVTGIVVCWSRKCKQKTSTNQLPAAPNSNEAQDTDQQYCNTQRRSPSATANVIDIKQNVAYHAYDFPEPVYVQPHIHSSTQDDYEFINDYDEVAL